MIKAYLGLGSNLGNRKKNIKKAVNILNKTQGLKVIKFSRLIETYPVGGPHGQPNFLNGAAVVETTLSPQQLLKNIKNIEKKMGRKKTVKNGPRLIDIDILIYGNKKIKTNKLTIPHPRMHLREFVLKPLKQVQTSDMNISKTISSAEKHISAAKKKNKTIGFVPTMGCLHEGHISLIKKSREECDFTIVSIFVNPRQFGPSEDYAKYPRNTRKDLRILEQENVDLVFTPKPEAIYPSGFDTSIKVGGLGSILCGASRPGHFDGVATVVVKLLNIIRPDAAFFGQKDAQQAVIVKNITRDLNINVKIKILPIIREKDGLAMSSRNIYLSPKQRQQSTVLYESLLKAKEAIKNGVTSPAAIIKLIENNISKSNMAKIDYISIVNPKNMQSLKKIKGKILIVLAVYFNKTRLIDNLVLNVKKAEVTEGRI